MYDIHERLSLHLFVCWFLLLVVHAQLFVSPTPFPCFAECALAFQESK